MQSFARHLPNREDAGNVPDGSYQRFAEQG